MKTTFVDTSFFLALALADDQLHERAISWKKSIYGKLVTTEFVLIEIADDLSQRHLRGFTSAMFALVGSDPQFLVVPLNRDHFERGSALFVARRDKEWGLTDCISFEVMREMSITDALTYDHHFEQAGFHALLREDPPNN